MQGMKYKISLSVVAASLLFSGQLCAQSVFGLNFIGEHKFSGNARAAALGYSALALPDTASAISMNSASLADINNVTFSLFEVLSFSRIGYDDIKSDQTRFQMPIVNLAVPLRKGLVFGLGYRTRFEGKADFSYPREFETTPAPNEQYKLNSSLFTTPLILAWRPVSWLRISGELQIERGSIKDEVSVYFDDPLYNSVSSIRTRSFSGTSWALSMLLRAHPRLWIGGSYDEGIEYSVDEQIKHTLSSLNQSSSWDFSLPAAVSAGFGAGMTDRWWITGSYWRREGPEPTGFAQLDGAIGDENLIAFGVERKGSVSGGLFSRIPVRAGFYRNQWHLEFPQGKPVISNFFTLGSGFPLPGGPGDLDFTLEFGKIGSATDNGIDEKVFRLGISMSFSESWTKRKIDRH